MSTTIIAKSQVKISVPLNTVIILVGPSRCGKTTFAWNLAKELEREYGKLLPNAEDGLRPVSILTSDAYRSMLTGGDTPNYCTKGMQEMSEQAFQLLFAELVAFTSYPVNSPFIIVDTTGLDTGFRNEVMRIAEEACYHVQIVLFDLPHSEFYNAIPEERKHEYTVVIASQAKRFKTEVMPSIRSKDFDSVYRLRHRINQSPNVEGGFVVEVDSNGVSKLPNYTLSGDDTYVVVGDIHEHDTALNELVKLVDATYTHDSVRLVLIGDYLDKGGFTKEIINTVWTLVNSRGAIVVRANHENYVVKRILGELDPNLELEKKSFSSLEFLLQPENKEYADKVVDIWNRSVPYVKLTRINAHTVYVTHAPCHNKYIGKVSEFGQREQRNLRRFMADDARPHYEFFFKEARNNHPMHIVGHVAHCATRLNYKNKYMLDTGAVYGGKLSAMVFTSDGDRLIQINCEKLFEYEEKSLRTDAVTPIKVEREFDIGQYDLSDDAMKTLWRLENSRIQYVSGTMAPARSTKDNIESLEEALKYFKDNGVAEVVLEPKYMGSRGQIYLYRDTPEKSFAVSRNGYVIREALVRGLIDDTFKKFVGKDFWKHELVLDCELMPWALLGEGLINRDFTAFGELVLNELMDLDHDEELAKLTLHKRLDLEVRQEMLNTFFQQLALYGGACEPHSKPFSILKIDGAEVVTTMSADEAFSKVSEDEFIIVNTEGGLSEAQVFFDKKTTDEGMEGVVVKPRNYKPGVAPYMKVRNESYLSIVYGYDYKLRYSKLCEQKKTNGKLRTSIREHDLAVELLNDNGSRRTELMVKMISELGKEKSMDPRL